MASGQTRERETPPFTSGIRRGEVLSGAELVQQSLKDVSRQMRRPTPAWAGSVMQQLDRMRSSFGGWIAFAFVAVVILPVTIAGLYLAFFAADQYASEARFAVRGGDRGAINPLAVLTGGAAGQSQDSLIIADYIHSRGMVEALSQTLNLREMFDRHADWVFGFNPQKPIEKLTRYWHRQVDVHTDSMSGIVTVVVRAFTPQDALAIAKGVIAQSETLVNDLSERARRDALKQAQGELKLAETTLQDKIKAMRDLRNREGLLDAGKTSDAMTKLVGDLRLELARMESEYSAARQSVESESPQMRVLQARIRSTREQIRLLEARMTQAQNPGAAANANPALAESMGRFERLQLEQSFAQKHYVEAAAALERARADLDTQQVYLTTFLQPVLAQEALYPKKGWILAALTAICLALWGAGTGIAVLVRNYGA